MLEAFMMAKYNQSPKCFCLSLNRSRSKCKSATFKGVHKPAKEGLRDNFSSCRPDLALLYRLHWTLAQRPQEHWCCHCTTMESHRASASRFSIFRIFVLMERSMCLSPMSMIRPPMIEASTCEKQYQRVQMPKSVNSWTVNMANQRIHYLNFMEKWNHPV